jgi:hypothetical protein
MHLYVTDGVDNGNYPSQYQGPLEVLAYNTIWTDMKITGLDCRANRFLREKFSRTWYVKDSHATFKDNDIKPGLESLDTSRTSPTKKLIMDAIDDYQLYAYSLHEWIKKWNPVGIAPPHDTIRQRIDLAYRQMMVCFYFAADPLNLCIV